MVQLASNQPLTKCIAISLQTPENLELETYMEQQLFTACFLMSNGHDLSRRCGIGKIRWADNQLFHSKAPFRRLCCLLMFPRTFG
jgi:hypothetical protein